MGKLGLGEAQGSAQSRPAGQCPAEFNPCCSRACHCLFYTWAALTAPSAQSFATFPLLAWAGSRRTPNARDPRPALGREARRWLLCVQIFPRSWGIPRTLGFPLLACEYHISPSVSPKWVLGAKVEGLAGWRRPNQQLETFPLDQSVPNPNPRLPGRATATPVAAVPAAWHASSAPLGGLGQSLTLSSKTLSFPNTRAWSSCPTCTRGSFSGLSLSSYLLFLPEVQNGSLAASRTGQRILFGPHRAFCL